MKPDYFLSRKSCRNFKTDKISDTLLEDIISQASKSPTCGNMQLYSVVVTSEPDNLKKMAAFHYNQPAATSAPCILTVCADFNRFSEWCKSNNADAGFDNFHSFIMALTDAVIFAQQIVTIAELQGLGTCYLGTVNYNAQEISQMLQLPALVVPVAAIAVGWPAKEGDETKRLPVDAIFHKEVYRHDDAKIIRDFFKVLSEDDANEKFIAENGKENIAQVFSEVRYPRSVNEEVSRSFLRLLKEKGFMY
ncbi:MAG: nitroreductase family protein [Muribaculaceae bacterium]|nr:nitroreductase family protein [Muribaculaceae bacterium]